MENIEKSARFLEEVFSDCAGSIRIKVKNSPIRDAQTRHIDVPINADLFNNLVSQLAKKSVWGCRLSFLPCTLQDNQPIHAPFIYQRSKKAPTLKAEYAIVNGEPGGWFIKKLHQPLNPSISDTWEGMIAEHNHWLKEPNTFPLPLPWSTNFDAPDLSPYGCINLTNPDVIVAENYTGGDVTVFLKSLLPESKPTRTEASSAHKQMMIDAYEEAKQQDLVKLFSEYISFRKMGKRMVSNECPFCKAGQPTSSRFQVDPSTNLFYCFACGEGGGPIEYGMWRHECSKNQAALILSGKDEETNYKPLPPIQLPSKDEMAQEAARLQDIQSKILTRLFELTRSLKKKDFEASLSYLADIRGLPVSVLQEAWRRELLSFLPDSPYVANDLFLKAASRDELIEAEFMKPDKKIVGLAFNPILFPYHGKAGAIASMEFRKNVQDTNGFPKSIRRGKIDLPWIWRGSPAEPTAITEGCIDGLSLVPLLDWPGNIISIPGIKCWKDEWLGLLDDSPYTITVFDNDPGQEGENAAKELQEKFAAAGYPYEAWTPMHLEQDVNSILNDMESKKDP